MRVIDPKVIVPRVDGVAIMRNIEKAGRVCYKSEGRVTEDSYKDFLFGIIKRGHESVLEHEKITVTFICDRGVSHELVRHRIASFSQESTRYCNYGRDKRIMMIRPCFWRESDEDGLTKLLTWQHAVDMAETYYLRLIELGCSPQEARSVLPSSLKTEVVVTANIREWRHILKLRCAKAAHPQIQQIMIPLLLHFKQVIPELFWDIGYNTKFPYPLAELEVVE